MRRASARGIAPDAYGADLPEQASYEERRNVWAVRWLYHHFQYGGLCVRPPWSLVEHIGFDALATNAADSSVWSNPPLRSVPPVPERWPEASEHVDCRRLWRRANPYTWRQMAGMARRMLKGGGAKDALPSFLIDPARRVLNAWRRSRLYRGDYANWDAARAASTGYDANLILEKAVAATRAVRDGQALWERDTVLFHEPERNEPLLRALAEVAAPNGGRLSVLDFGGALGSTWWQHRQWLGDPGSIRWSVIEQPAFVEAGRREFTVGPLRFYGDIDACLAVERPDVILLSSVLPYLENPHAVLADLASRGCGWIIIDRTGFATRGRDWLAVQHVPEAIYPASYPCWFFDRAGLLDRLGKEWSVVAEWPTFDGNGRGYEYRGLMLKHIRPRGGGTSCT